MLARLSRWLRRPLPAADSAESAIKVIQANTKTTENLTAAFRGLTDNIRRTAWPT